jgi:hypothetical protein
MKPISVYPKSAFFPLIILILSSLPLGSCITDKGTSETTEPVVPQASYDRAIEASRTLEQKLARCSDRYDALKKSRATTRKDLDDRVGKLQLSLVEKDAQIEKLEERHSTLQKQLNEAIQEVVRAKAKLRSLESRAEAASNMAETEIALKAFKTQRPAKAEDPELVQAEELLKMSSQEFKRANYGGALYLAGQAKGHIRNAQIRIAEQDEVHPIPGEILFALPLSLRVAKSSNVREGPGLNFRIIATLEPDTRLIGYSYKGQWVRVKDENGLNGWIFQSLLSGR